MKLRVLKKKTQGVIIIALLWFIGAAAAEICGPDLLFGSHEKTQVIKKESPPDKTIDNDQKEKQ